MLANQYCEIIVESVRQIVDVETLKLRNNIEQMHTGIIKSKTNTEYVISYNNDTETVRASIDNTSYTINDSVYFTLDTTGQVATIQGKTLADNEVPIKQLHDYDDFVKMEEIIAIATDYLEFESILNEQNEQCYEVVGFKDAYRNKVNDLFIPGFYQGRRVISIKEEAFLNNFMLKQVYIAPNIEIIKVNAFAGCMWLSQVGLPATLVTIEEGSFSGAHQIKTISCQKGFNITTDMLILAGINSEILAVDSDTVINYKFSSTVSINSQSAKYTRLGVSGIINGDFKIVLQLHTTNKKYSIDFYPEDLIGVTSGIMLLPLLQKKAFNINLDTLQKITLICYNLSLTGNLILNLGYDLTTLAAQDGAGLALYIDDETRLKYKTKYVMGALDYDSPDGSNTVETGGRLLYLRWLQQNGDNYIGYTQQNISDLPLGTIIKWYRYNVEYTGGDDIAGIGWENFETYIVNEDFLNSDSWFTQNIILPLDKKEDKFKAALLLGADNYIVSNELVFTNEQPKVEELVSGYTIGSSKFNDGIINLYGWDNKIKADFQYEANKIYNLILNPNRLMEGLSKEELDEQIVSIQWKVPSTLFTIPEAVEKPEPEDEPPEYVGYTKGYDNGYQVITIQKRASNYYKIDEDTEIEKSIWQGYWPDILPFKLVTTRIPDITQYVTCDILLANGATYHAERGFTMSLADGIMGTNNFVITHLYDGDWNEVSAINMSEADKQYYVTLQVYDSVTQEDVEQDASNINIKWRLGNLNVTDRQVLDINIGTKTLTNNILTIPLTIIQATPFSLLDIAHVLTIENLQLKIKRLSKINKFTYHLPIATTLETNASYKGPSRLYYDTSGQFLSNLTNQIIEYTSDDNNSGGTWQLQSTSQTGMPQLTLTRLRPALILNSALENDQYLTWDANTTPICLLKYIQSFTTEGNPTYYTVYNQPLIFERVTGFSSYLNDWNGSLKIDKDNNLILSSAFVAGHKTGGSFNGVIIGEIGKLISDGDPVASKPITTGIFGYQKGTQTYSMTEDGVLILGATGNGQIIMDGTKGYIMSGNFQPLDTEGNIKEIEYEADGTFSLEMIEYLQNSQSGTFLDLVNGNLFTNNGYFRGKIHALEGGTLAGWDITSNSIEKNDFGSENGFYMGSSAKNAQLGQMGERNWLLGIGSNFGVTNTGALYANSGKIGHWHISSSNGSLYTDALNNWISLNTMADQLTTSGIFLGEQGLLVTDGRIVNSTKSYTYTSRFQVSKATTSEAPALLYEIWKFHGNASDTGKPQTLDTIVCFSFDEDGFIIHNGKTGAEQRGIKITTRDIIDINGQASVDIYRADTR